ncbi:hypothetical protein D046_1260A, partial [Vibrio parahaemolyticus V-223/04]
MFTGALSTRNNFAH